MDEPPLVIDATDEPRIFQAVGAADSFPFLFALDLQGRLVFAPAKQDKEQPRLVDAAEPHRLFDAVRARRLIANERFRFSPVFVQHPAIGFKPGICDEKALVTRRLDNFHIPCAAQLLKRILCARIVAAQQFDRMVWQLSADHTDLQQQPRSAVPTYPHCTLLPDRKPGFCRAGYRSRSDPCHPSSSSGRWSSRCRCHWSASTAQ